VLAGLTVAVVLATAGCASDGSSGEAQTGGEITVFAAASLSESFTAIGKDFQEAHPGTTVTFSFGGSSTLAQQINSGAPADVFASASPASMKVVTDAGSAKGEPTDFVKNRLVIAVPNGNSQGIRTLADLAKPGVKVAVCAEQVPCGAAAKKVLDAAGVKLTPVTFEQDVKAALAKARLGEVDAALVYRTDAKAAASDVDGIEFPESAGAINTYPIVVLKGAPNPEVAKTFVEYVLSEKANAVLTKAGFQAP